MLDQCKSAWQPVAPVAENCSMAQFVLCDHAVFEANGLFVSAPGCVFDLAQDFLPACDLLVQPGSGPHHDINDLQ